MNRDVIVSNGFNRFHLAVAAAELDRRNRLALLITGAYPTARVARLFRLLPISHTRKATRLLDRAERIEDLRIRSLVAPEILHEAAASLPRQSIGRHLAPLLGRLSWRLYGAAAAKALGRVAPTARIFHYRAGFGGKSAELARRRGLVLLCDHSIAHPAVIDRLVDGGGRMPSEYRPPASRLWQQVLEDIERADAVLVNSEFVKSTFVQQGWPDKRLHVLYLGVDDRFLQAVPSRTERGPRLRLLFAGALQPRKGAIGLMQALRLLDDVDWLLEIAGPVDLEISERFADVLADPRVSRLGILSRTNLAGRYAAADVFVFPSLAEGSARVVFEALAAGCYVVTTPNAGSVVEDGVHGRLVPPDDPTAVAEAIREASKNRGHVAELGARNAKLVRTRYTQRQYGDGLEQVYQRLLIPAPPGVSEGDHLVAR